jgi:diadenosine tetraphosphate (Ap4A) HIT family hydrolase
MMFPAPTTPWLLHPQLAAETFAVGDLTLSRVLLMNDTNYPWLVLVPRQAGAVEIIDLDDTEQAQLMREIALTAGVLKDVTVCDKLNIAAIGNVVAQLHVHIVVRRRGDAAWPRPVWGTVPARAYEAAERERFIAAIRAEIAFC